MTAPLLVAAAMSRRPSRPAAGGSRRLTRCRSPSRRARRSASSGPSGSGKSTLARVLLRLVEPDGGRIDLRRRRPACAHAARRCAPCASASRWCFRIPLAAFNPRATVAGALGDPLRIHGIAERAQRRRPSRACWNALASTPRLARRAIHEISGGQRQRVAIARALATRPDLIVLDEPVSALDVSVRGKILDLLVGSAARSGIAYLFVSHDLAVVRAVAHRIAIMDAGRIVESGPAARVVADPQSPTGHALIAAVPRLNLQRPGTRHADHLTWRHTARRSSLSGNGYARLADRIGVLAAHQATTCCWSRARRSSRSKPWRPASPARRSMRSISSPAPMAGGSANG